MKFLILLLMASCSFALDTNAMVTHLKYEEGFRHTPYRCTSGFWTVGYGHRCSYNMGYVSKYKAERILLADIAIADAGVKRLLYGSHPPEVEFILVSMSFQIGVTGVYKFKKMLFHINNHDYVNAAMEMRDSKWRTQTGSRCERLASIMESL